MWTKDTTRSHTASDDVEVQGHVWCHLFTELLWNNCIIVRISSYKFNPINHDWNADNSALITHNPHAKKKS